MQKGRDLTFKSTGLVVKSMQNCGQDVKEHVRGAHSSVFC